MTSKTQYSVTVVPAQLREHILNNYQFCCSSNRHPHDPIRIDDCTTSDIHDWSISVFIPSDLEVFLLQLENVPHNQPLEIVIQNKGGRVYHKPDSQVRLRIPVKFRDVTWLRKLAKSMCNVTGRGQRYFNPNWKWMSSRVADSISEFANHLKEFKPNRS